MKKLDNDVREYIASQIENVQLEGLCPICKTARSQNGECWCGHIVIDVRRPIKWGRVDESTVAFREATPEEIAAQQSV